MRETGAWTRCAPGEGRELADRTVDEVRSLGAVPGIEIDIRRDTELRRCVRTPAEDGLAPDDDDLRIPSDRGSSANDVFQLRAVHWKPGRCAALRQTAQRVRGSMTPAKGEVWRRARAR